MVREDVISTKTIGDEKELNNIFGIENESVIENENNYSYDKLPNDPNDYEIREILFNGLIDMETWNKINEFEKNNPDKIRKWREEDEEKNEFRYRDNSAIVNVNKRNGAGKTCEEKVIKICILRYPKNKFVLSVSEQYKRYGKISEKQFNALENMIGK